MPHSDQSNCFVRYLIIEYQHVHQTEMILVTMYLVTYTLTDQITFVIDANLKFHVHTFTWVTIWYKYHGRIPLYCRFYCFLFSYICISTNYISLVQINYIFKSVYIQIICSTYNRIQSKIHSIFGSSSLFALVERNPASLRINRKGYSFDHVN